MKDMCNEVQSTITQVWKDLEEHDVLFESQISLIESENILEHRTIVAWSDAMWDGEERIP